MPNWNTLNPSCQLEKLSSAAVSHCVKGNHFLDRDLYFAREQCVPISRTCSHNYFVKNSVKSTYLVLKDSQTLTDTQFKETYRDSCSLSEIHRNLRRLIETQKNSRRLTETHRDSRDSRRLTETHRASRRLIKTHGNSQSHRDSQRLTATRRDSQRLTKTQETHGDSQRLTDTNGE